MATLVGTPGLAIAVHGQTVETYRNDRILVKPAVPNLESLHARQETHVLRRWPRIENIQLVELRR